MVICAEFGLGLEFGDRTVPQTDSSGRSGTPTPLAEGLPGAGCPDLRFRDLRGQGELRADSMWLTESRSGSRIT